MTIPDLGALFVSLLDTIPLVIQFVLILMGLFGLYVTASGLYGLYVIHDGEARQSTLNSAVPTIGGSLSKILLGGGVAIPTVLIWQLGGTFALGGSETDDLLAYVIDGSATEYCDQLRLSVTLFFMLIGVIGMFYSATTFNAIASGYRLEGFGQAFFFLFGGTLAFFITDIAVIIGNTTGLDTDFAALCATLG